MLEPGNRQLAEKLAAVERLRREGRPTVPSAIAEEKAKNPFLRVKSPDIHASVPTRPDKRNALTTAMIDSLQDAVEAVAGRDDVRVVVIRGEGAAFCAGLDLRELA